MVENRNSVNKDLFHGKDGDLVGQDEESQELGMVAPHLLQPCSSLLLARPVR